MEIKRWPAFLALTFSVSFRAFALAQELNDKPDAPSVGTPPVIGTIVVEDGEKTVEKSVGELPPGSGHKSGYIIVDAGTGTPIGLGGGQDSSVFGLNVVDPATLPKFVIGVSLTEVPDSLRAHIKLAAEASIMVGAVVPLSPAAKAGLQQYDILLKAGDQNLHQPKELQDLVDASEAKPLSITIQRQGEQMTLDVTPIKREELKTPAPVFDFPSGIENVDAHSRTWLQTLNGQAMPAPLNMNSLPPGFSPFSPPVGNPPQVEALTDSIRKLTEQVERLQGAIDKLEKK